MKEGEKMLTNREIREKARESLKDNWGYSILVALLLNIILSAVGGATFGLGGLILIGPLTVGTMFFFMNLVRNKETSIEDMFSGFSNFVPNMLIGLLTTIFVFLWNLLLIIPGIIAYYRYGMVYFIANDNPDMDAMQVIQTSKEMMRGYKLQLFLLELSFIGWALLSLLTFGIGILFLMPYIHASKAAFYESLKEAKMNNSEDVF